jgi:hypothetical protein
MTLKQSVPFYTTIAASVIFAGFLGFHAYKTMKIRAISQDVFFAIAYARIHHEGPGGAEISLVDIDSDMLLTNVTQTGVVNAVENDPGGSLTMSLPDVGAYICQDVANKFNKMMDAQCDADKLTLYLL